jgi:spore coat protein U-like protein
VILARIEGERECRGPHHEDLYMTLRHTLLAVAILLAAGAARAQTTASATFQVSANVAKVCTIVATPINLGAYDPTTTATTNVATGTVTVQCTKNTPYDVKLDNGANGTRRMKHASLSEYLSYQLYSDSAHQLQWDSTTFVTGTTSSNAAVTHTVFALIPPTQDVAAGAYSDTVSATINF